MFLGTDDGLYVSVNAGKKWIKWTEGFPTVSVKDLVIQPREHDLVIGTFGRAAWVLDDIRPLRAIAKNKRLLNNKLELFSPPTAYQAAYQQPTGSRFGADALYQGENKGGGAILSYYAKIDPPKKKAKNEDEDEDEDEDVETEKDENVVKWDSIHLKIYDGSREIRHLKWKAPDSTGIHKTSWFMNEKGGDRPSRTIRPTLGEPGGVQVKPGTYKLVMSYGDQTSEQSITVKSDPRLNVSTSSINEVYTASKELEGITQTAADAVKQLVQSKNIANEYSSNLSKLDKKAYKDQIKASKDIVKKIDSVIAIYLGKVDRRQGITRNPEVTVMQRIGSAAGYVGSRKTGITSTERTLMKQAKDALKDALNKTNAFFNDDWKPYQSAMEQLKLSPFKETKTFGLD